MNQIRIFLTAAACMMAVAASAQWQWIDKDGRKVFSDRAPPVEVQEKNILKRPGTRTLVSNTTEVPPTDAATAPQPAVSIPKLSGVDKELEERKKKAQEAELAKRKAEEEKILKAKVENCARAKQAKASFDSGVRIAHTNDKGEREVMDDAARASEIKRIQSVIDADCK
jgi:hypothetical protein